MENVGYTGKQEMSQDSGKLADKEKKKKGEMGM